MAGRRASRAAVCHRTVALASLLVWLSACSEHEAVGSWSLAAIGEHQAAVGTTWIHELQAQGAVGAIDWRLRRGPEGMTLLEAGHKITLTWTPTAFDLHPNAPGTPRQPGSTHEIEVIGEDAQGAVGRSVGAIRAGPVGLTSGIDAPANVVLDLALKRSGRWLVRSDTTALLGAAISLDNETPPNTELIGQSKGVYWLRFRPDEGQLRRARRYAIELHAVGPNHKPVARTLTVELRNRGAVVPCGGSAPALRTGLEPQLASAKGASLALAITATDVDSVAAWWSIRAGPAAAGSQDMAERKGALRAGRATASADAPTAGLLALALSATDLDDPIMARCVGGGRWPRQGVALVGVGTGCADDPAPDESQPPLGPGQHVDRRLCPGAADHLRMRQGAGTTVAIIATVPPGWPGLNLQVDEDGQSLCTSSGRHTACWLSAPAMTRTLRLVVSASAPTSTHVEIRAMDGPCLWQAAQEEVVIELPQAATVAVGLCPGERRILALPQPATDDAFLRWRSVSPFFEVEELDDGDAALRRWQVAGALDLAQAELPGRRVAVHNPGAQATSVQVRWGPPPPSPPPTASWLPSFQDSLLRLPIGGAQTVALARNDDTAMSMSVDLHEPPVAALGSSPISLPITTAPWPPTGPPGAVTAQDAVAIAALEADAQGLVAMSLGAVADKPAKLWVHPSANAPPGCPPDRYDGLAKGQPVRLLPAAEASLTGQLRLCAGLTDAFVIQVPQDGWLEVAVLAATQAPSLAVTGPGGRACQVETTTSTDQAGAAVRHTPPIRRTALCWATQSGDAKITVTAGSQAAIYDLAVRVR